MCQVRKQTSVKKPNSTLPKATAGYHPSFNFHILSVCSLRWLLTGDYAKVESLASQCTVLSVSLQFSLEALIKHLTSARQNASLFSIVLPTTLIHPTVSHLDTLLPIDSSVVLCHHSIKITPSYWIPLYIDR